MYEKTLPKPVFTPPFLHSQLVGSLLFVGSVALRIPLGSVARGSALEMGMERGAVSLFTFAGWLLAHPEPISVEEEEEEDDPTVLFYYDDLLF